MKRTLLIFLSIIVILEGLAANYLLWHMQFDSGRGQIVNYGILRVVLTVLSGIVLISLIGFLIALFRRDNFALTIFAILDGLLLGLKNRLFLVQGILILLTIFLAECFLLSYLAIPVPMRPILAWAALNQFSGLAGASTCLCFRVCQAAVNACLAEREVERMDSRTAENVCCVGIDEPCLFYWIHAIQLQTGFRGRFYTHSDEAIIYPDVVRVLVWQGNFSDMVHVVVESWPWWYGYPYLPISAVVLLVPRLVLGNDFASNIQLNIFLLRQFVSVFPMLLSIMLIIYLANKYKSLWQSVGVFVFLALVPGVVKFNYRFWHPDAIIVLLILLTLFFLVKDQLKFGRMFFLAAVTCGLATAIKLWGLFFVLSIGGYLLAGIIQKKVSIKIGVISGLGFILVMMGTIIITSPGLLAPISGIEPCKDGPHNNIPFCTAITSLIQPALMQPA